MNFTASTGIPAEFSGLLAEAWARTSVGLCFTDAAGTIRAVNPAFADITGYSAHELTGTSILRLQAPEGAVAAAAAHQALIAGDKSTATVITYLHKSGRPLFTHTTDLRLVAEDGRAYRLTTLVDLDRETRSEARLQQIQRAEGFVALAGAISNDFNNLLSIILGYAAFLQDSAGDARRLQTAIEGIEHAVHRAAGLIKQTLYLTHKTEPVLQRVKLASMAEDFMRTANDEAVRPFAITLDVGRPLPAVSLDPHQIGHVLVELCRKAAEFLDAGGRLHLSTELVEGQALQTRYTAACEPLYAVLVARFEPPTRPAGTGTPFSIFSRAVDRRRDLSIMVAQSILDSHRGLFESEVLEHEAVIFRMYFPALPEPVAAPVPDGRTTPQRPAKVLLVDDEESLLHALSFALTRNGCEVLKARDGFEAVDTFKAHSREIALVLCDLGLPNMSGWEAFMKMKEVSPDVRVLVMSGHLEPTLHAEITRAGAKGFLQKPFSVASAVAEVRALLGQT
ncbi:MAG TPA: response regulator [Opitutaceae bacterium]